MSRRKAAGVGKPELTGIRITYVVTSALTAIHLLSGQLRYLRSRGLEIALICAPEEGLSSFTDREGVELEPVPLRREISPFRDLASLGALLRRLRNLRPDCVNASTPKAALLALLAARALKIPVRIYTVRGLRLETTHGPKRWLLRAAEKTTLRCATHVICVSSSLRERLVELQLAPADKLHVLGSGSSNGVDHLRFSCPPTDETILALRQDLGLQESDNVVGFVGRLTRDKGVGDLVAAFDLIRQSNPSCKLLVIGDLEEGDSLSAELRSRLAGDSRIVLQSWADNIEEYYPLMDVLAFPSYREGFPNAPLEAACAQVPAVGYRVTGTEDALVDGVTGRLVDRGDINGLATSIGRYLDEPDLRRLHGEHARQRVIEEFRRETVWKGLLDEYGRLFAYSRATTDDGGKKTA